MNAAHPSFAHPLAAPVAPLLWDGQGVAAGAPVATTVGPKAAGRLRPGDRLLGAGGVPVTLAGLRRVHLAGEAFRRLGLPAPVLIAPGALGFGRPSTPLLVGPAQLMRLSGTWVAADLLVDGRRIRHADQPIDAVALELDGNGAFLAAGTPLGSAMRDAGRPDAARVAAVLLRLAQANGSCGALEGHVDHADRFGVIGWARHSRLPDAAVPLEIAAGGQVVAHAIADMPRDDLVRGGGAGRVSGTARHGFAVRFATPLPAGRAWLLEIRRAGSGSALPGSILPGSPVLVDAAGSAAEDFEVALAGVAAVGDAPEVLASLLDAAVQARHAAPC